MNILDIILICLLVLTSLIGCFRGFISTLLSFVGSTLSFVCAFFLAKPLGGLLSNLGLTGFFEGVIKNPISSYFIEFSGTLTGNEILSNQCSASGVLKLAFKLFINPETSYTYNGATDGILPTIISHVAAFIVLAISMIIAFILIKIVIYIIAKIFDSAKKNNKALNGTDKLIGLIVGACKGFLIIAIACIIANLLQGVPAVASVLDSVFDGSIIGKPLYDFITNLAGKYLYTIDISSVLSNII